MESEFNEWYDAQHLPRLTAVPGVLCGRRFTIASGRHRYLATYHLDSLDALASQAWKDALATPWTEKMRPDFRDPVVFRLHRYPRQA